MNTHAPLPFFVLRSPLLPIEVAELRALLEDPVVVEALHVASPGFLEIAKVWSANPTSARCKGVELALTRYVARMTGRATPFGLFAGVSLGTIAAATNLELGPRDAYRRHVRLDMRSLASLHTSITALPEVAEALLLTPNRAAARFDDEIRCPELGSVVSTALTKPLAATLDRAEPGARAAELAAALKERGARDYIDALVDAQLLERSIAPAVTGDGALETLLADLRALGADASAVASVQTSLAALALAPLGVDASAYGDRELHVDLHKSSPRATLGADVIAELTSAIATLQSLCDRTESPPLARFREQLEERYGEREVPLLEALDDERGVGFPGGTMADPSPLLADLEFPAAPARRGSHRLDGFLVSKLVSLVREGAREWVLSDRDVDAMKARVPSPLPDAFSALANVHEQAGELRVGLQSLSGPSTLLGRFCHGDPALLAQVRHHLAAEEALRPDVIFAEVAHLPEGKAGNVVTRPRLREWEISYVGRSGAPRERTLFAADLRVSVRDGRVVLRSARDGREVIPRLTSAFDASQSPLAVIRFLDALQSPLRLPRWSWGELAGSSPFLPRVRRGRCVLSPAQWRLTSEEIATLRAGRWQAMQQLRERLGMPSVVALSEHDELLPVRLDDERSVASLVAIVRDHAVLVEMPELDASAAHGPEGRYANEVVIPFIANRTSSAPARATSSRGLCRFTPGSSWLSMRIYGGEATADRVLTRAIAPIVTKWRGSFDRWFFLRYADPNPHLRVRFQGPPSWLMEHALPEIHRALAPQVASGAVWRVDVDTYDPEIERYGGATAMPLSEALFDADSEAALQVLRGVPADALTAARPWITLASIHHHLVDLGLSLSERLELMTSTRDALLREHPALERQLGARFRRDRTLVERAVSGDPELLLPPILVALSRRGSSTRPLAASLRDMPISRLELFGSHIHMLVNRWLRSSHRASELVLCDLLRRQYASEQARRST